MNGRLWLRAALGGLAAWALSLLVVSATVTGYALALDAQAPGEPDPGRITRFATLFSPVATLVLTGTFAFIAGRWAGRSDVERRRMLERRVAAGILIGAAAALPALLAALLRGAGPGTFYLLLFAVAAALGVLGAVTRSLRTGAAPPRHAA